MVNRLRDMEKTAGSIPAGSTILKRIRSGHHRDNAKRLLWVKVPVCAQLMRFNMVNGGVAESGLLHCS